MQRSKQIKSKESLCFKEKMLGLIIKIMALLIGIFSLIFSEIEIGLMLIAISVFLLLIGLILDKILMNDAIYSWKELINVFKGE